MDLTHESSWPMVRSFANLSRFQINVAAQF